MEFQVYLYTMLNADVFSTVTTINMTVCEEDKIHDIRRKYNQRFNAHSGSYTWRKTFRNVSEIHIESQILCLFPVFFSSFTFANAPTKKRCDLISGSLDFNTTLTGNGLLRESLPPAIWLFYDDDFTIS